jgi:hypothetical protein
VSTTETCPNCGDETTCLVITPPLGPDGAGATHCGCFYAGDGSDVKYHVSRDPIWSPAETAPILCRVTRYRCPFCRRTRSTRTGANKHIARCFKNPHRKPYVGELSLLRTMLDKHGEETTPPAWYPGPGYIYDGDRWHPVPGYSRSGDYDAWPVGRSGSLLSIESAHQRLAILQPIGDPALPLDF